MSISVPTLTTKPMSQSSTSPQPRTVILLPIPVLILKSTYLDVNNFYPIPIKLYILSEFNPAQRLNLYFVHDKIMLKQSINYINLITNSMKIGLLFDGPFGWNFLYPTLIFSVVPDFFN